MQRSSDDARDPRSDNVSSRWADYRLSASPSRQIFVVSSLELATPKATPVESHPHRRTRGKLCRFASYSNEEFVGDEHSFNSAAGRLKVGRD